MNRLFWSLARSLIRLRSGRVQPATLDGPVWYFAFGCNMNERLFRQRRHMTWLKARTGRLDEYRLAFTVAGERRLGMLAPANIVEALGETVCGVLCLMTLGKFARLDSSEGNQYAYLWTGVVDADGNRIPAIIYRAARATPEDRPSRRYMNLVQEAARQFGLPAGYVSLVDQVEART